jgi:hypothetical protein
VTEAVYVPARFSALAALQAEPCPVCPAAGLQFKDGGYGHAPVDPDRPQAPWRRRTRPRRAAESDTEAPEPDAGPPLSSREYVCEQGRLVHVRGVDCWGVPATQQVAAETRGCRTFIGGNEWMIKAGLVDPPGPAAALKGADWALAALETDDDPEDLAA